MGSKGKALRKVGTGYVGVQPAHQLSVLLERSDRVGGYQEMIKEKVSRGKGHYSP